VVQIPNAALTKDLDADLQRKTCGDLLPMEAVCAHNWAVLSIIFASRKPYARSITSLGCPYRCIFLLHQRAVRSQRYRMRKPEAVVAEIKHLFDTYGVRTFPRLSMRCFVLNDRPTCLEICDALIASRAPVPHFEYLGICAC